MLDYFLLIVVCSLLKNDGVAIGQNTNIRLLDFMQDFPKELLPSSIFTSKKAPVLWIGAGISKRYVKGFVVWEEILAKASEKAGINRDQFIARRNIIRNELGPKADEEDINSAFALDLSSLLNDMIASGDLDPKSLFDDGQLNQYRHDVDPLKLLICDTLKSIEFRDEYKEEIALFRNLSESTPIVITTNYDMMIETLFNNSFKVFSCPDEYYFSDSLGIGEIYKIHGTIKRPRSLVINSNDYEKFRENSFVLTSKIVSAISETPLVIMGYSMGDKMIRDMLGHMFRAFTKEKKELLARNILYIDYRPGEEPKRGTMQIQSESGTFYINTISVDDYSPVLKDLSEFRPSIPVTQIRFLKKMFVDIISENPIEGQRIAYVGIEGIDDVDPKRTVIAFTTAAAIQDIKGSRRFEILDLIHDVVDHDELKLPARSLVDVWFESVRYDADAYIPIFHYLRELGRNSQSYSPKMQRFIENKHDQYQKFIMKKHSLMIDSVKGHDDFINILSHPHFIGNKFDLVTVAYMNGWITEKEAIDTIRNLLKGTNDKEWDTSVKRAITCLAFKEIDQKCTEVRTLATQK